MGRVGSESPPVATDDAAVGRDGPPYGPWGIGEVEGRGDPTYVQQLTVTQAARDTKFRSKHMTDSAFLSTFGWAR